VLGLKAAKNRTLYDGLRRSLGRTFLLSEDVLDASDFDVPQTRKRLIIVGLNRKRFKSPFEFPKITRSGAVKTVRDAIGGLPEPVYFSRSGGQVTSDHHPNHWTMFPQSKKFSQPNGISSGRSFQRLNWDKPSRTVAYGNREIHIHPTGSRRLSIFEAMMLQGFPEEFRMMGNLSEQVTQVSNAVPPPVARAIAAKLMSTIFPEKA
jgi:DNA (cytosine-5)-methyltransferase 1